MDDRAQAETNAGSHLCPQCGAAEDGFFCRNCGALLHGEDRVLCPRCRQIVPDGEYCNQCGQSLSGLALHLRQLALAGDTFWVTAGATTPPTSPEPVTFQPDESVTVAAFQPDESVTLAAPELPDWLQELPSAGILAESDDHIYPALTPLAPERAGATRNSAFLVVVVLFILVLMIGLMFLVVMILLRSGA
jgi:hypothetical protein